MPTITFNGVEKHILIGYDGPVTTVTAEEIYSRWKDWVAAGNAQYEPAFAESVGGNDLGAGVALSGYFFIRNDLGWHLLHSDYDYEIRLIGDFYPADANLPFTETTPDPYSVQFIFQRSAASYVVSGSGSAPSASQVANAVWGQLVSGYSGDSSMGAVLGLLMKMARNKVVTDPVAGTYTVYDDDGTTVLLTANLYEDVAGTIDYRGQGADRRERLT